MCSVSESDDVGNKAEGGAWGTTVQGLEFQDKMGGLSLYFYPPTALESGTRDAPLSHEDVRLGERREPP